MRSRRGMGLAELLVSLALGAVILAAVTRGLVQQVRLQRDRTAQARADEIVREVHEVLRAEVNHAAGTVAVLGDTALDLASLRLFARACDHDAARLIVSASEAWWSPARAGDSLALVDTSLHAEWRATIAAVGTQQASASCPAGGTRLLLGTVVPTTVPALAVPVRVWRVVRYTQYRAGDGTWWFGERSCTPTCGAAQPIAGPLAPPVQRGLELRIVPRADGRTLAVDVAVRTSVAGRKSERAARLPVGPSP